MLLLLTIGFIIIGFFGLISMKKDMESKFVFIKVNPENKGNASKAKSVIWWIVSAAAWGVVSIYLVGWCFRNYFG